MVSIIKRLLNTLGIWNPTYSIAILESEDTYAFNFVYQIGCTNSDNKTKIEGKQLDFWIFRDPEEFYSNWKHTYEFNKHNAIIYLIDISDPGEFIKCKQDLDLLLDKENTNIPIAIITFNNHKVEKEVESELKEMLDYDNIRNNKKLIEFFAITTIKRHDLEIPLKWISNNLQ